MAISKNRKLYLEAIRIFATFFVVYTHTGKRAYFLFASYSPTDDGFKFWGYLFITIFCKVAVPLFLAISGALLFSKDEPLIKTYKRALRFLVILVLVSLIYYMEELNFDIEEFSLITFLLKLYTDSIRYHLWYLYTYIGFILAVPFIKHIARNLSDKTFIYLLGLFLALGCLRPSIEYIFGMPALTSNVGYGWISKNIIVYPVVGYYLANRADISKLKKYIPVAWVFCIFGIAFSEYLTYLVGTSKGEFTESSSQTFVKTFSFLTLIAVFITFRVIFENIEEQNHRFSSLNSKLIVFLAKNTFIVYLVHPLVMSRSGMTKVHERLISHGVNDMLAGLMYTLLICLISNLIACIIKLLEEGAHRLSRCMINQ